jgi:hypothetical protein
MSVVGVLVMSVAWVLSLSSFLSLLLVCVRAHRKLRVRTVKRLEKNRKGIITSHQMHMWALWRLARDKIESALFGISFYKAAFHRLGDVTAANCGLARCNSVPTHTVITVRVLSALSAGLSAVMMRTELQFALQFTRRTTA